MPDTTSDDTSASAPRSPTVHPVVARTTRDLVAVTGADAATYLQGQLSQEVTALAVGETAWTFVLAPQGKVEGWGRITRVADDGFEVLVDVGAGEAWDARLRRFLLRTRADIAVTPGVAVLALRGEGSAAVLTESGVGAPVSWRAAGWPTGDGYDLVVAGEATGDDVVARLAGAGATEVDAEGLEALRIRAGVPAWGRELDADTIPASVGQWVIDASVSFTKGCYTGQELVARIDSRGGHVPRLLHRLEVPGPPPAPGTAVLVGEAEVGPVTSSAPVADGSVALVWVPRSVVVDPTGTPASVAGASARLLPPPGPAVG
jgi:folate-binding protein YgfZ